MKKALALKYTKSLPAPFIVAKGSRELAKRIEESARKHGITVAEGGELTDALYPLDVGTCIPERYYEVVAALFAWLAKAKGTR
jgi:flagellar biosynthesis protein FlhB